MTNYLRQLIENLSVGEQRALTFILDELNDQKAKRPDWPADPVRAAAMVSGASGGLMNAALLHVQTGAPVEAVVPEATRTGAAALRLLASQVNQLLDLQTTEA